METEVVSEINLAKTRIFEFIDNETIGLTKVQADNLLYEIRDEVERRIEQQIGF